MRFLKIVLYVIAVFFAIWIVVAFLSPSEIQTEQSIVINKKPGLVFNLVNNLKEWKNWSPWVEKDPEMKTIYGKKTAGIGAKVKWESQSQGSGEQTIVESRRPEFIRTEMIFNDWDGKTYSNWIFEPEGENSTKVTWTLEGSKLPFLMQPLGLFWNSALKKDYRKGLENLKSYAENLSEMNEKLMVKVVDTDEIYYVGKRLEVTVDEIGPAMGQAYAEIMDFLEKKGIHPSGHPFSINYQNGPEIYDFTAALPVERLPESGEGNIEIGVFNAGKAATITHFGNYESLDASYRILTKWIEDNRYRVVGSSWEVYITDPETEKDTAKWETQIFFPVQ